MVLILQPNQRESFSNRLLRGLGQAGQALPSALGEYEKTRIKQAKDLDKRLKGSKKFSDDLLKRFHPGIYEDEKSYNSFGDRMKKYVSEGYSDDQAMRAALGDLSGRGKDSGEIMPEKPSKIGHRTGDKGKFVGGWLESAVEAVKKDPSILGREAPVAVAKSLENYAALDDPLSAALKFVFPSKNKPVTTSGLISEKVRQGVAPELHEGAEKVSDIGSFLLDLLTPLPKGVKAAGVAEKGIGKVAPKIAEKEAAKLAEGVVSKELPKGATVSRLERLAPEGKLFKKAEQEAVREQQLKLFPKYAEEIASDAAERAARMEAKLPKTAVGEAGLAKRMAIAEAELPKAKDLYQKAIARVRGLEDSLAKGVPAERKQAAEALYDMAVKELNDSEFYLKTVLNNAKTGEARVGFEQMRQAARNKLIKLEDDILSGHEPKLSLKDYNPEIIKKAKALEKKKQLPGSRHEDYFTQVHEGYANEYRQRLTDLDREIEKLKKVHGISPLQRGIQIKREKEAVQKLIDHIDAENAIHRHKMALRETGQRQVAKERLGQFTRQAGEQKVKDLAKEALKSPEKAAEMAEVASVQAAEQMSNGALKEQILKEKGKLSEALQQVGKMSDDMVAKASIPARSTEEAAKKANGLKVEFEEFVQHLKNPSFAIFKTKIGYDILSGMGYQLATELASSLGFKLNQTEYNAFLAGTASIYSGERKNPFRGTWRRVLLSTLTKLAIDEYKKNNYKNAYRNFDDENIIKLKKSYPSRIRKEALEELRQERESS